LLDVLAELSIRNFEELVLSDDFWFCLSLNFIFQLTALLLVATEIVLDFLIDRACYLVKLARHLDDLSLNRLLRCLVIVVNGLLVIVVNGLVVFIV